MDDVDLVRTSTAHILRDPGQEVVEAVPGEVALRLVDGGLAPDFVITVHLMPGLSGVDLARRLRLSQRGLPVRIMSGYAEIEASPQACSGSRSPFVGPSRPGALPR